MFGSVAFLRAIAALWVLAAHCMIWGGWYGLPLPDAKLAVDLFMAISGFLMVDHADRRRTAEPFTRGRTWIRFWARRFFRLAPAYYLSLAIAALTAPAFLQGYRNLRVLSPWQWRGDFIYDPSRIEFTAANLLAHVTFVFGLSPEGSFSTMLPDWSLGLEMQFYAAFPLLLLAFDRWGWQALVAIGAAAALLARQVHGFYEPSLLVFGLPYFLAGMLAARHGWLAPLERLGWFGGRLVRFGSDCSYGVYLFHGFWISAFGLAIPESALLFHLPPAQRVAAMFVFVLAMSYGTAWLVFRFVEAPGIEFGKKWMRK